MATEIFGPILPLLLDSRNVDDVVRGIQSRMFIESGGALTDFTPASPLAAISEGQGYAQAELLYYLNSLPEAVTLQWLRTLGIQRKLGARAEVEITLYKVPGYQRAVNIPAGSKVYANGGQVYITLTQVSITSDSATVLAQSERWGTIYNVGQGQINRIDKNYLGLDYITNLQPATGGEDLESAEDMKFRAFELFGRRNLTSKADFEAEIAQVAPEAEIVKVLSYEERFGQDSRGIFIVAGGSNGSPLSTSTQTSLITSIRDKVPLDCRIYLAQPTILPVEVVVNITWDPLTTSVFTDTMASEINQLLLDLIDPAILGLGNSLSHTEIYRRVLALGYVVEVPVLDIKERIVDLDTSGTDTSCGRFVGEDVGDDTCLYTYNAMVTNSDPGSLTTSDPTSAFKLYKSVVSLTSTIDYSTLTYTYDNLYELV